MYIKRKISFLFFVTCFAYSNIPTNPNKRLTSYPYISGDTFRAFCDFIIDETNVSFDPLAVKDGDIIFLNPDPFDKRKYGKIGHFFNVIHPQIQSRYILVTHNSLFSFPGKYERFLDDEKLIAWFGKNLDKTNHPKACPLPIGLANTHWPHGNIKVLEQVLQKKESVKKDILLYSNFAVHTNKKERNLPKSVYALAHKAGRKPWKEYLYDLARSKFVMSPEGAGTDCHRTWEALLMGSIPIIKHSTIDDLFKGLPVLFVDDWSDITYEFLQNKYQEFSEQTYDVRPLYADYWFDMLRSVQKNLGNQL